MTPKSATKPAEKTTPKSAGKSTEKTAKKSAEKSKPLATPERRKRHRLSQAHVRLERMNLEASDNVVVHRTRNALVAEFKENNIMTRKRQSLDQIKSPTRRMEQLKKLTPTTTTMTTIGRSSRNSSASSSPSVTPLPKRRSVSDRTSPIPLNLKMLSESAARNASKTATAQPKTATSRIPTRTANAATSSRLASPTKTKVQSNQSSNSSQTVARSRLPLRKSNRTSQTSFRKK